MTIRIPVLKPCLLFILTLSVPARASDHPRSHQKQKQEEKDQETSPDEKKPEHHIYWDDGLHLRGWFDLLRMKIGGQAQNDTAIFSKQGELETELGRLENGVEWRRARLYAAGLFTDIIEFKLQYDFASNNPPNLKDAYVGLLEVPFLHIPIKTRAGRFKNLLGLEIMESGNDTTFMERGLTTAFLPTRNTGIMFHGDAPRHRIRWAIGFVQQEDEFGVEISTNASITGRFATAFRPGGSLVHVGVDFANFKPDEDTMRLLERPESHIAPQFVDTGDFPAQSSNVFNAEGAFVKGPLSFQGEFTYNDVKAPDVGDPNFYALYAFGSYFLTGETRHYKIQDGAFGRIYPKREFRDGSGGMGAFEIAFRFSRVDLDDKEINGGRLNDLTAGFNWYATHNYRVIFNVIRAKRSDWDPVWIFQVRLQVAF
jgi:phosphate-selective porin OprO/OprP